MASEEWKPIALMVEKQSDTREDRFEVDEDYDSYGRFDMGADDFGF